MLVLIVSGGCMSQNQPLICEHCQDYIPEGSRFCPQCGGRIEKDLNRVWLWLAAVSAFGLAILKVLIR